MIFLFLAALEYHTPQIRLETYTFTSHASGAALFTATAGLPLQAEPGEGGKVLASLPFGAAITIEVAVPGRSLVADRVDQWYAVRAGDQKGYVFGAWLTPYRFAADFDDDGEEEVATVAFSADFSIVVRVHEPRTKKTAELFLPAAGQGYLSRRGGNAEAELVSRATAGLPLVVVWSRPEACSDFSATYVSYTKGRARVALAASGLIDPPNRSTFVVTFEPAKKRAMLVRTSGEEEKTVTTQVYTLADGVFSVLPAQ